MNQARLRTKIICTIGPASREPDVLNNLIAAGMDVARLNFSHGDHAFHADTIARVRAAASAAGKPVALLADLQGPKLRVGDMGAGLLLEAGKTVVLTTAPLIGQAGLVPIQYADLPGVVRQGERILLDDGLLELEVRSISGQEITCQVLTGGLLTSKKGMNLPDASLSIPAITEKDRADLAFALGQGVDWVALSFVRSAAEVRELKALIRAANPLDQPTLVIAKIEKPQAVTAIEEIIADADGIMVARGDLGIEMLTEEVPVIQKRIIRLCNQAGKPVITATQMLDSMIRNPRPTRAEASDVANAVFDGTDAVMLSGETASGLYPVATVQTMAHIIQQAEQAASWGLRFTDESVVKVTVAQAVAHASCETARDLKAKAIIAPTLSGSTARLVARFRPQAPVVAVTPSAQTQRQLMLSWGIYPLLADRETTTDRMLVDAIRAAQRQGFVNLGDTVVVTAGSVGSQPGATDLMKVHVV